MRADLIALILGSSLVSALPTSSNNILARDGTACPPGYPEYTVKPGDTGFNISIANNVSTLTLLDLPINKLTPPSYNLIAGQTLCLPPSCPGYVVQQGDDCTKISNKLNVTQNMGPNGVSLAEYKLRLFYGYNPGIENPGCSNLNYGTYVCLGKPEGDNHPMPIPGGNP